MVPPLNSRLGGQSVTCDRRGPGCPRRQDANDRQPEHRPSGDDREDRPADSGQIGASCQCMAKRRAGRRRSSRSAGAAIHAGRSRPAHRKDTASIRSANRPQRRRPLPPGARAPRTAPTPRLGPKCISGSKHQRADVEADHRSPVHASVRCQPSSGPGLRPQQPCAHAQPQPGRERQHSRRPCRPLVLPATQWESAATIMLHSNRISRSTSNGRAALVIRGGTTSADSRDGFTYACDCSRRDRERRCVHLCLCRVGATTVTPRDRRRRPPVAGSIR